MKYGYFDNDVKEYVITNPKTPVKWINYIGSLDFGGFVDHTGGALLCKGDPALNRIVKYIPQLPSSNFKGETLYVRVKTDSGYELFSPFFVPVLKDYESYKCRVGNGYSIYESVVNGIKVEVTIFIPTDSQREIRDIKVTNLRASAVEIDIIPVVEYTHFEAIKQFNNADWVPQTMQSKLVKDGIYTILTQCAFMKKDKEVNYVTSNREVSSFETDRKNFLGNNGYGTFAAPLSLNQPELSNYQALREDNIAAQLFHLGLVSTGSTERVITQLGQYTNFEFELKEMSKYRSEINVDKAFSDLKNHWDNYLDRFQVKTPSKDFDTLVNIHNPKQCLTTKNWSRFLSLYQLGLGARGIGFRDTSQDLIGVMGLCPEETTVMLKKLLSTQRANGSAMHQFFPLSMEATCGDSEEMEDRPDYYGDDHLWIVQTVAEYLKESGDFAFLDEVVKFYDKDEEATVLEHLKRSIEFTRNNRGSHGIPLLGFADWNDTVNLPTGSESIFNANLYSKALNELIELLEFTGDNKTVKIYKNYFADNQKAVNDVMWDGDWYVRYFDQNGAPIGSKKNEYGSIFTNAQSWTVMSGVATDERAKVALDSVYDKLNTKNGIKLSWPGYNGYQEDLGGVSTYPPGAKENGGIFLHSNPWVMIAETMMGNGDRAFEYHNQINPITKNDKIDEFECEPYVYPQNILGDEHEQFGLGRNSWLSGTASWCYQAATKYILGIKPDYIGLNINPCIPTKWDGFEVTKFYKNATYNITVKNPNHVSKGIKQLTIDGKDIDGCRAPIFDDGKEHTVIAIMG
ncbi:MAG: glycosyl transferase [Spirochaetaceae bacterium]